MENQTLTVNPTTQDLISEDFTKLTILGSLRGLVEITPEIYATIWKILTDRYGKEEVEEFITRNI